MEIDEADAAFHHHRDLLPRTLEKVKKKEVKEEPLQGGERPAEDERKRDNRQVIQKIQESGTCPNCSMADRRGFIVNISRLKT